MALCEKSQVKTKKMSINKIVLLLLLIPATFLSFGQVSIKGKVTAFNKYPLSDINIRAKKSKAETVTAEDGSFQIDIKKKDVLKIQNSLFHTFELKVNQKTPFLKVNLIFEENDQNIKSAVESGYFSQKDLEYALKYLVRENNVYSLFTDVYEAIKYAIPEASMVEKSNGSVGFILRGINSLQGNNNALFVVNQNVVGEIGYIVPSEIKRIWKLPTSQTAMYGSRAGNGVICIETY